MKKCFFTCLLFIVCSCFAWASEPIPQLEKKYKELKNSSPEKAAEIAIELGEYFIDRDNNFQNFDARKGLDYLEQAAYLADKSNSPVLHSFAYYALGKHYHKYKNYKKAISYLNDPHFRGFVEAQMWKEAIEMYFLLGESFYRLKQWENALEIMGNVRANSKKRNVKLSSEEEQKVERIISVCRNKLGLTKEVLTIANRFAPEVETDGETLNIDTELVGEQFIEEAEELLTIEEEFERQKQEIENLKRTNLKKYKTEQKKLEEEYKAKQAEVNQRILEKEKEFELEKERTLLYVYAAIGGSSILLVFLFLQIRSNRIKKKINRELIQTNQEILEQKEEIHAQKEEIEEQKHSIEEYSKKVDAERKKADELLANILPVQVAVELKETGKVIPRPINEATILFTDFVGFTRIAEKLTPEEIITELDACFRKFDQIVKKHRLEKIKTIGDAYMCVGGVPVTNSTHPEDAVRAALEMQTFIDERKYEKQMRDEVFFELRIGIHTGGPLVAGVVGENKFAFDIWGDAVNLAARMEQSGEPGRVNISEATYEHVKHYFYCNYRGKIEAKNKGEIDMYFVNGEF